MEDISFSGIHVVILLYFRLFSEKVESLQSLWWEEEEKKALNFALIYLSNIHDTNYNREMNLKRPVVYAGDAL